MTRPAIRTCYNSIRNHSYSNLFEKVRILSTRGHLTEALLLFYNAPPSLQSQQTYASLFHACSLHGKLEQGLRLHQHMVKNYGKDPPDLFVANHIVNMFSKFGNLEYAQKLFNKMPQRNIVSWNVLISGYAQHGLAQECFRMFSGLLAHFRPDEFTFASVLSSCDYIDGKQIHAFALKMSLDSYVYVANALINMYSKTYGFGGSSNEAWKVFERMEVKNIISWNSMIQGFQFCQLRKEAIKVFATMWHQGIRFDRATLLSVLTSLCGSSDIDVYLGLKFCVQLHCLCIKSGIISEIEVATALVKVYSDLGGDIDDCYRLFLERSHCWDIVSWTGIITVLAEHEPKEALFLFRQLLRENLTPNWFTFSIVLKACAGLMTERHSLSVHSQIIKAGFIDDTVLATALVHAYGKCGSITLSKQVFDEMGFRNLVSWNSMLKVYALHGQGKEALQLFSTMNIVPDSITFVTLLSACSHSGLVEEGSKIFYSMLDNYGIAPQLDHYACMVDILGRGGRVLEAEKLISEMPLDPDSVVWSALLGSCRKHGETRLAEFAAAKLRELEPGDSLGYVQMSNLYCSSGNFNKAELIRKEMMGYRVKKEPGLSWIEIKNQGT